MNLFNNTALGRANKLTGVTDKLLKPVRKAVADIALQLTKLEDSVVELKEEKSKVDAALDNVYEQENVLLTYKDKLEALLK